MRNIFNISNLYIALWCLYNLQGTLYSVGGLLSRSLLALLLIISLYYCAYAYIHYKLPLYFKGLAVLLAMFAFYGVVLIASGRQLTITATGDIVPNYYYLKNILMSLLPVCAFYTFSRKGLLTEKSLMGWVVIFILVATASYFREQSEMLLAINQDETTNNTGYLFLSLLPILTIFHKKPWLHYSLWIVCLAFILFAMKRGAIIIGALCLLFFLFYEFRSANRKTKIWVVLLSIGLIVASIYLMNYLLSTSDYFARRLQATAEGNTSGRDVLYSSFYQHFISHTNIFYFLFGEGANATLAVSRNYAHNDWLEIAINQGLFGILVYAAYWLCFYKNWRSVKKTNDSESTMAIGLFLIIYFMKTIFSMSYGDVSIYASCALGYYLANNEGFRMKQMSS